MSEATAMLQSSPNIHLNAESASASLDNNKWASNVKTTPSSSFDVNMMDINGLGIYTGSEPPLPHHRAANPTPVERLTPETTTKSSPKQEADELIVNDATTAEDPEPPPPPQENVNKAETTSLHEISAAAQALPRLSNASNSSMVVPVVLISKSNNTQTVSNGATAGKNELFFASASNSKQYSIEYPFRKIRPAYSIDSHGFFYYVQVLISFLFNVLVLLPCVILIALIFTPYKFILRLFYKLLHSCHLTRTSYISPDHVPEFLNPTELFWMYNSGVDGTITGSGSDAVAAGPNDFVPPCPSFLSKNACLFLLDGCVSKNKIRDLIKNRVIEANTAFASKFERFRQRIMNLRSLGFVWIPCTTFDLDEHIIEIDNSLNFESSEEIQSYLSQLISRHKFDLSKPLWAIYYKQTVNSKTERSSMIVFVSHQAFADGVSLMRLFFRGLVDNRNQLDVKPRFAYSILRRTKFKQLIIGWSSLLYKMLVCSSPPKNEADHLRRRSYPGGGGGSAAASSSASSNSLLAWSDAFDLMNLNKLKLITRSKMNDFLVSIVAGILRQYLQHKGINNPNNLRCLMPVDLRSNKFPMKLNARRSALCSFELPVKVEGCVPRLWATKCTTQALKSSSDLLLEHFLIKVLFTLLPTRLAYRCARRVLSESTCLVSTLGCGDMSLAAVSVANQPVKNLIYFTPTLERVSLSFSLITYGDEVRLAVVADSSIISNPEFITRQFIKQLTILSDLLSNRRIPGEVKRGPRPGIDFDHLYAHPLMDANQIDDYAVTDVKIAQIQQELQQLTESLESLDSSAPDYNKKRQVILIKSDKLRKEFSRLLADMRSRSNQISQAIPSDDEDELEPDERIRLRSASVASRVSSSSHSRRFLKDSHSEHSAVDRPMSSRKASLAQNSRHGSLSYSSGQSHSREFSYSHGNSNLTLNHNHATVSTEHEMGRNSRHHN